MGGWSRQDWQKGYQYSKGSWYVAWWWLLLWFSGLEHVAYFLQASSIFYIVFMLTCLLLFEDDPYYILNTQEIGCPNMIQHAGSVVWSGIGPCSHLVILGSLLSISHWKDIDQRSPLTWKDCVMIMLEDPLDRRSFGILELLLKVSCFRPQLWQFLFLPGRCQWCHERTMSNLDLQATNRPGASTPGSKKPPARSIGHKL